ncbi:hypothetical protein ACHAXH_004769 [Discostella pseudostelligera]
MSTTMKTPITPNEDNATNYSNKQQQQQQNYNPSTPSPQCVDEFYHNTYSEAITSANRSAIISRMLSDHYVTVNDDEVLVSSTTVTLPELEEATTTTILMEDESEGVAGAAAHGEHARRRSSNHDMPTFASTAATSSPLIATPKNNDSIPPPPSTPMMSASSLPSTSTTPNTLIPIQHKLLYQCVSSFASPLLRTTQDQYQLSNLILHVGPEREVLFHTDSLGIKLSRHTDGYVRVLSVTPYRAAKKNYPPSGSRNNAVVGSNNEDNDEQKIRTGEIYAGDVVREVCGVDLRYPIDSAVWKMTVGLMKMAPRPLQFVVARELPRDNEEEEEEESPHDKAIEPTSGNNNKMNDSIFGPTREIHFLESCLGVKLHHSTEGYVQILSVTPYKSFPNSPLARIGEVYAGDIVLQVGGVWDLREPIDDTTWGVLIKFIRETRRPLSMVVADGNCLEEVEQVEVVEDEDENRGEEETEQVKTTTSGEPSDATDCGADRVGQGDSDKEGSEASNSDGELRNVCHSMSEQTLE